VAVVRRGRYRTSDKTGSMYARARRRRPAGDPVGNIRPDENPFENRVPALRKIDRAVAAAAAVNVIIAATCV